jgi:hypothetical protein
MTFNIDDLTLGQIKEIQALVGANSTLPKAHPFIGKHCIVRAYSAGVHAGEVVSVDGENVILKDSRRLWSWKANDGIALSGVSQTGIKSDSKVDVVNPIHYITGVCELIPTTDKARESINGKK